MGDQGSECTIDQVVVDKDAVAVHAGNDNILISPDGCAGVTVGEFEGTDPSVCLKSVRDALGW